MQKDKGIKWNTDTNKLTNNGKLIFQLLDRHNHDVFTHKSLKTNDYCNKQISSFMKSNFDGNISQNLKLTDNYLNKNKI